MQTLLADPATTEQVSAATVLELSLEHHQGRLPELEQSTADPQRSTVPCRTLW